ncbi:hypothetical protein ONS96_011761 [Cadophora gregata f. sp. sojae]|nr:hypothetical protein ONS96_011761 [Cadophora gregata f. sp. sojae]
MRIIDQEQKRRFIFFPNTFLSRIASARFTGIIRTTVLYGIYEPEQVPRLGLWTEVQIWSVSSLLAMLIVSVVRYYAGWSTMDDEISETSR